MELTTPIKTAVLAIAGIAVLSLTSCVHSPVAAYRTSPDVGGVPKWISTGAKFDAEPEPWVPDAAIIPYKQTKAPLEVAFDIERNFKPTPVNERPVAIKETKQADPVATALEKDYKRNRRIRSLVR
ncbi:MAG: hypothetical protein AAF226_09960 [Verrucomicrobiota bacterium]